MSNAKISRLTKKVKILEEMLENKTRQLYEKNEYLMSLTENIGVFLFVTDQQGIIIQTSKFTLNHLNMEQSDILGKSIKEFLNCGKSFDDNLGKICEVQLETSRGLEICALFSMSKLPGEGGFIFSGSDLTDLKGAQEVIRNQEMTMMEQGRLKSLGEMASMVAHEVKNPLGIMDGQLRRLGKAINKEEVDKNKTEELIGKLKNNIQRINKIVESLKSASRDSSHDEYVRVDINKVVDVLLELSTEKMKFLDIEFSIQNNLEDIYTIGRESELEQVLLNLLNNAVDAISELDDKWIRITLANKDEKIIFNITDSGSGIPLDVQGRIFDPFFTTKDVGKGTGIGMSIVKNIIDSHRGTIEIDNTSSNTCFIVSLPVFK